MINKKIKKSSGAIVYYVLGALQFVIGIIAGVVLISSESFAVAFAVFVGCIIGGLFLNAVGMMLDHMFDISQKMDDVNNYLERIMYLEKIAYNRNSNNHLQYNEEDAFSHFE